MIGGASFPEFGFAALLFSIVLLAPVAPRVGEAIGGLFEERRGSAAKTDKRV
jgi:hypothetical protein